MIIYENTPFLTLSLFHFCQGKWFLLIPVFRKYQQQQLTFNHGRLRCALGHPSVMTTTFLASNIYNIIIIGCFRCNNFCSYLLAMQISIMKFPRSIYGAFLSNARCLVDNLWDFRFPQRTNDSSISDPPDVHVQLSCWSFSWRRTRIRLFVMQMIAATCAARECRTGLVNMVSEVLYQY